ncbi:MAG: TRAP transporter substrate-binding protein DctP [Burkholderiaceae bacterium]|jgi:TRAP-type C4-dicarboxylate transport system substrate-binding protein|nr:TRAP transporter substrate-binding protein DctP [Burkholderiaceae bacterium]
MKSRKLIVNLLAALITGVAVASPVAAEKLLRIQTLFTPSDRNFQHMRACLNEVADRSGGKVRFDLLPVGATVGPTGTMEAVGLGVLDGHFTYSPLWTGIEPAFPLLSDLTGGHEDAESLHDFFYNHGGLNLLRRAYDRFGVYVAGVLPTGIESLPSRRPVRTVADLKGMKIRVPAGITATVFQRLGAAPVTMPMSEAYGALEKGVVDAADIGPLWWNHDLGVHQFAKYELQPSMHSNIALDLSFNKKTWAALPAEVRTDIESSMRPCGDRWMKAMRAADVEVEPKVKAAGVTLTSWSPDEREKFRSVARTVWTEFGARSPLAKEALDAQMRYLAAKGVLK